MAMTNRANIKRDGLIMSTLDDLVPQDHLVRTLEATIDWKFIYPLVKSLYSNFGRRSIDPVVLFKMIFINYTFGINSMRKTCEEIKVNIAYRWFLGISIYEDVPNYSTWSKNYQRRYKDSEVFDQIFNHILRFRYAGVFRDHGQFSEFFVGAWRIYTQCTDTFSN
mgnify:CR=1 FL=1